MLEHFNDYISLGLLILIVLTFLFFMLRIVFKGIERRRIRKDMERRDN